jgi:hypothetical protein
MGASFQFSFGNSLLWHRWDFLQVQTDFLLFTASSSGRILSNGAQTKTGFAISLKNFRKTTASKFLPIFLLALLKFCWKRPPYLKSATAKI